MTMRRALTSRTFARQLSSSTRNLKTAARPTAVPKRTGTCIFCQYRLPAPPPTRSSHQPRIHRYSSAATPPSPSDQTQPPTPLADIDRTTHYTLFPQTLPSGPPPTGPFTIPLSTLRKEFLQLQALAHPDRHAPGPAKQSAEALSARINEAYKTLQDPLLRAQYLLQTQHNIDVTAEDGGASGQGVDQETLMEVLDVQERIEEAMEEEELEGMKGENRGRIEEGVGRLGEALERGDVERARREAVRLRYWYSIKEGLGAWEPGREVRLVH